MGVGAIYVRLTLIQSYGTTEIGQCGKQLIFFTVMFLLIGAFSVNTITFVLLTLILSLYSTHYLKAHIIKKLLFAIHLRSPVK